MIRTIDDTLSQRLKAATNETHDQLDRSIMDMASFKTLGGYGRFASMQYLFHRDIAALYDDDGLRTLLPGLAGRQRLSLIAADLADLGLALPRADVALAFPSRTTVNAATALGWLYVAEGSNMGAALLRKEAAKLGLSDTYGARHLAPAAEGPAAHWRAFTAGLNVAILTDAEEARAIAGAQAAFSRVRQHADIAFA